MIALDASALLAFLFRETGHEEAASHAALTAAFLPQTRALGLSLADRACLALARSRDIPALTADKIWQQADVGVDILLIR